MQYVHYLSRHNVQDIFQKQCGFGQFKLDILQDKSSENQ